MSVTQLLATMRGSSYQLRSGCRSRNGQELLCALKCNMLLEEDEGVIPSFEKLKCNFKYQQICDTGVIWIINATS